MGTMRLSIAEAADLLGVTPATVRRRAATGRLRAERVPAGRGKRTTLVVLLEEEEVVLECARSVTRRSLDRARSDAEAGEAPSGVDSQLQRWLDAVERLALLESAAIAASVEEQRERQRLDELLNALGEHGTESRTDQIGASPSPLLADAESADGTERSGLRFWRRLRRRS
jgi:excisionase family DNA binding protein